VNTDQHRLIMIATVLGAVVLLIVGALVLVQPQLAAAGVVDLQRADIEQQSETSRAELAELESDSGRLPELQAELDELRASIPASLDSSAYLTALGGLASSSGVTLSTITVESGQPYAVAADAAADPAVLATIVTSPLITADSFVLIPVSLGVTGSRDQVLAFLDGLQHGSRLFLVTSYSAAGGGDGGVVATISGYIYVIPTGATGNPGPDTFPTPTPAPTDTATPAPTGTATPGPTPSSTPTP
jgi:Tfp pilus assembly protein PilO